MFRTDYTESVANSAGPDAIPRAKVIFSSLIRHLHDFVREVDLTNEEWIMACDHLVDAGKMSTSRRNEMILISDVLGLESLIEHLDFERFHKEALKLKNVKQSPTNSAILGPFYRKDLPTFKNGDSIVLTHNPNDVHAHLFGKVLGIDDKPIVGATVDIWHTGSHGFYDSQIYDPNDPSTLEFNWRGRFITDEEGRYDLHCLTPTPYPIPYDSTTGHILKALDRSPMRPAHIHFLVQKEGYRELITQVYDATCQYLDSDSVFGVKASQIVEFKKIGDGKTELEFDIVITKDFS